MSIHAPTRGSVTILKCLIINLFLRIRLIRFMAGILAMADSIATPLARP